MWSMPGRRARAPRAPRPLPPPRMAMARPTPFALAAFPALLLALALGACAADPVVAPAGDPMTPNLDVGAGGLDAASAVDPAAAGGAAAKRGTITISLRMRPEGPADVAFTTDSRTLRPFALDDDADPALANAVTFRNVKPGAYTIRMANAPDGPLTAIRCASTGGTDNNTVDVATRTATLNIEAGESVACTFVEGWGADDLVTRTQGAWDNRLGSESPVYAAVYSANFGAVEVGIPGTAGFSMRFGSATAIENYLTASGTASALSADLVNPTSAPAGVFGGNVLALQLDVDFSDAGVLGGTSGLPFGDLTLCAMTDGSLDGRSVREVLGLANTLLGGGSNGYAISAMNLVVLELTAAFSGGVPSAFAQDHLFAGACP